MVDLGVLRIELKGSAVGATGAQVRAKEAKEPAKGGSSNREGEGATAYSPTVKALPCHPERRELVKGAERVDLEGGRTTRIKCRSE